MTKSGDKNFHINSDEFDFTKHPPNLEHHAGEDNIYTNSEIKKPTSSPYVYTVSTQGDTNVFMFGSDLSLSTKNFNNALSTSFFYDLTGYFGGGAVGYVGFLGRTIHQSFSFGRFRLELMEGSSPSQLHQPLNIVDQDPSGKQIVFPAINYAKLNQFYTKAIETECDITIYGGTQLTYLQLNNPLNTPFIKALKPAEVKWFFWPAEVASLTRALEAKPLIKDLKRPETYLVQLMKLKSTMKKITGK